MGWRRAVPAALTLSLLLSGLPLGAAAAEVPAPTVAVAQDASLGTILTGPNGMTLYVFTKDAPGVTNCYGQCAVNWPPLLLKDGESLNAPAGLGGELGTVTRTDGTRQVTLNGAPLYYWVKDKAPGETTGHKVQGVWFVGAPGLLLDVAGTWAQPQVSAAVRAGWAMAGADGKFHMNDQVTRAEFAAMVTGAFKVGGMALPDGWTAAAQAEPDRAMTRAEAAGLLVQALGLQEQAAPAAVGRFTDLAGLSADAAGLVGIAVERGIVQGYPDKTFRGGNPVTRAEAVTLIARALTGKQ